MPASQPNAPSDQPHRAPAATRLRCVVVDDDPNFLKLTEVVLARVRPALELVMFAAAREALDYFRQQGADLVITDIRMPFMDGLELTAAIRALDAKVPIVVISSEDLGPEAMARGANVFLTKSVIVAQLGSVVARFWARPWPAAAR
jgi:CheY-like chemotaxis protein